jgi:hypothetical protein
VDPVSYDAAIEQVRASVRTAMNVGDDNPESTASDIHDVVVGVLRDEYEQEVDE